MRSAPLALSWPSLLLTMMVLGAVSANAAAPPQFDAQVSTSILGLDETLQVVVTLGRDASQSLSSYTRPDPRDFELLSQSQAEQTQWTLVNGVQSVRTVEQHTYVLRPRRRGSLTIPPAVVKIDGRELKTRELVVTVTAPTRRPSAAATPGGTGLDPLGTQGVQALPAPEGMSGAEDVFLEARAEVPRSSDGKGRSAHAGGAPETSAAAKAAGAPIAVHVGEQLLVTWLIYTRGEIWRYRTLAEPKHDDFWSEDLYSPPGRLAWQRATVKGQEYEVAVLMKRALFPLRAGKLTITPLAVEATTAQTAFYAGASAERASRPINVEVLPLPAAGRPDGFEPANVGRFEVSSVVDSNHPRAGDAISLKVTIKGQGNLRHVKLPRLEVVEGFKVYDPTSVDDVQRKDGGVEGTKVLTYLMLPRKGGPLAVPAVRLPYYDPWEQRYQVSVAPAINITVEGDPEKIGAGGADAKENVLGPRIKPLRIRHHVETSIGERLLRGRALLWGLLAPPSILILIVLGGAVRDRLRRETAGSRRRRARAAARRHLRLAELHIRGGRPSQFFGECVRAIYEHLEYRLGTRFESFTVEELRRLLIERGFAEAVAAGIAAELLASDFARFGASAPDAAEMKAVLRRVRQLLEAIERAPLLGGQKEAA